jgi:hypothetical protein
MEENSHMPFRAKINDNEILLFCKQIDGVWKVHMQICETDEIFKLETGTSYRDVECSPTISSTENGRYLFSFISGQVKRQLFYSEIYDYMELLCPFEKKLMANTYAGFVSGKRTAYIIQRPDKAYAVISDRPDQVLMLPGRFCYRISFQYDNPDNLLISGAFEDEEVYSLMYNLETEEQSFLYDGYIPMYKASICEDIYEYAQKFGADFEERRIVRASNIVLKSVEDAVKLIDKKGIVR